MSYIRGTRRVMLIIRRLETPFVTQQKHAERAKGADPGVLLRVRETMGRGTS